MEKTIIVTGKTIDIAIESALAQLGLERDDVSVQVLAQAKAGFLGLGASPAKVEVTYNVPIPLPRWRCPPLPVPSPRLRRWKLPRQNPHPLLP